MERLTKRVGCGEAVTVAEGDICAPFVKAGLCKTGSQGFPYSRWERHCNDTCVLGTIIDKLAAYEDSDLTPEEAVEYGRLRKAGRIKIMPCAPGDTVYVLRTRHTSKFRTTSRTYDYACTGNPNRLKFFPESCYVAKKICTKSDLLYLGKTVFATEEAAVEALKEARNNAKAD